MTRVRRYDDSLLTKESSVVVVCEVTMEGVLSGMVTGVIDRDWSLLLGWLGVEWFGRSGRVDDVGELVVMSRCRLWVGEELFKVSILSVSLVPTCDDGDAVIRGGGDCGVVVSRMLNILCVGIWECMREEV